MRTEELEGVLKGLPLHSLLLVVSKALARSGFGDVQMLDRRHSRQKSRYGGHELLCETALGTIPASVIVKVVRDEVRTRMLDELSGAVLRRGATCGLLVTPYRCAGRFPRADGRISVLDGEALSRLLVRYGIGTRTGGSPDYAFFASLEEAAARVLKFISCQTR